MPIRSRSNSVWMSARRSKPLLGSFDPFSEYGRMCAASKAAKASQPVMTQQPPCFAMSASRNCGAPCLWTILRRVRFNSLSGESGLDSPSLSTSFCNWRTSSVCRPNSSCGASRTFFLTTKPRSSKSFSHSPVLNLSGQGLAPFNRRAASSPLKYCLWPAAAQVASPAGLA